MLSTWSTHAYDIQHSLQKYSYTQMESAAYMEYASPIAGASYHISGDLALHQREPIAHKGTDNRYNVRSLWTIPIALSFVKKLDTCTIVLSFFNM